jgi:hypothetical protein
LKASLWFSIGKIIDEESLRLNTNVTPQFIGAMTEMVWAQIGTSPPLPPSPLLLLFPRPYSKTPPFFPSAVGDAVAEAVLLSLILLLTARSLAQKM